MDDLGLLAFTALGILASIVLPILSRAVRQLTRPDVEQHSLKRRLRRLWRTARPYVLVGLFSVVTGAVVLAVYKTTVPPGQPGLVNSWSRAFLYGYTYDSTLQKLVSPGADPAGSRG